jgi:hypothetical protein
MIKKSLFLFFAFLVIGLTSHEVKGQNSEYADTVVGLGGNKIVCKIIQVSSTKVTYQVPDKEAIQELERKNIQKLLYESGRVEVFNKPLVMTVDETDWRSVVLTEDPSEVEGLTEKGKVESVSYKGARNKRSAKRNAQIRLQKQAANLGATIVLITNIEAKGGYGEIPSYKMKGTAYGW